MALCPQIYNRLSGPTLRDEMEIVMPNNDRELNHLNDVSTIYATEDGSLNRDITSHYSCIFTKKYISGKRAVQMGLGDGYIAANLCNEFDEFTVIEGSDEIIRKFQPSNTKIHVTKSLFESFNIQDKFDCLLGNHVLEHVDNPIEIMRHTRSWLKPGAVAIFTVPNAESLHRRIGVQMGLLKKLNELNEQDKLLGHRRVFTLNEFANDATKAGYAIKEIHGFMIKLVSHRQMKDWPRQLLDACFAVSLSLPPEMCSNIALICENI